MPQKMLGTPVSEHTSKVVPGRAVARNSRSRIFVTVVNLCALFSGFKWYDEALFR